MSFDVRHSSGLCRLHDEAVPEAAVALEETFVRQVHDEARLHIRDVRRGGWWAGRAHDQDLVWVKCANERSDNVEKPLPAPTYQ